MIRPDDNDDTTVWIDTIRTAQIMNDELIRNLEKIPDRYYERNELIRYKNGEGKERIPIPREIAWDLINKIHKFLIHFGTDKILDFVKKHFFYK